MLFFKKKRENGVFFKNWGSKKSIFKKKGVVFVKTDLKVCAQTC